MNASELPISNKIDIKRLGRLFDNMSESYKLFWFKAIVDSVHNEKTVLLYNDLINEMIASSWYMVSEYKLNLGPSDTMEKLILAAYDSFNLKSSENKKSIIDTLNKKDNPEVLRMKKILTINVPYRLQAPFLDDVKGSTWNNSNIASTINDHKGLLYYFKKIDGLNSTITVNDDFVEYVKENYEIISGWIRYKMIEYLQKRNPSVPGIIYKLDPPIARNLKHVKDYWKEVINATGINEIYHNDSLKDSIISIDHFVPWSYVAHDELWNLTPTTKSINSSKSNNLPNWDKYFIKLCELQYRALEVSYEYKSIERLFNTCLDEYVNDVNIRNTLYRKGKDKTEFFNKMKDIVEPVYNAAHNLGFSDWQV